MKFNVNQQEDLQQALNYCQGVIEKRSTLPILSNILLDVSNSKLTIVIATGGFLNLEAILKISDLATFLPNLNKVIIFLIIKTSIHRSCYRICS